MGLGSLFRRRQSAASTVAVTAGPGPQEPPAPEQLAELQDAWAELTDAVRGSGVTSFHACSRNGKPWQEDPAAVRSTAALLHRLSAEDSTTAVGHAAVPEPSAVHGDVPQEGPPVQA